MPWLDQTPEIPAQNNLAQKILSGGFESTQDFIEGDGEDTYEQLMLNGRNHLCTIPYVTPPTVENTTVPEVSQDEKQKELVRASNNGVELLKGLQEHCLYYQAGWWVYSFCYNQGVKQFHPLPHGRGVPTFPPAEDKSVHSFMLGRVETPAEPPSSTSNEHSLIPPTELQTQGETNYLVQKLAGGTVCDLTGQHRRIEVQFHCNPANQDRINMIKETASCVYLMVIHTPRLCNDVAFLPPQIDKPNIITCQEIVDTHEIEAWKARKTTQSSDNFAAPQNVPTKQDHKPLSIGGIVVGGQVLVGGAPERTVKVSNAMAAAQAAAAQLAVAASANNKNVEKLLGDARYAHAYAESEQEQEEEEEDGRYIATLAKSDGKFTSTVTDKEMKKLGLQGTKKDLESWIERLSGLAGEGEAWRLDVYETAEGKEFRGILGGSGDDGDEVGKKEEGKSEGKQEGKGKVKNVDARDGREGEASTGSEEVYKKTKKKKPPVKEEL